MKPFGHRRFGESKEDQSQWRRTNSNRRYYIPSVAEIRRKCALLRERWDKNTLIERKERVAI